MTTTLLNRPHHRLQSCHCPTQTVWTPNKFPVKPYHLSFRGL